MKRETQNVLLLLVGGALLKITVDGTYLRYVKPVMAPLLIGAGIAIVGLALIAVVRDIRESRTAEAVECGDGHEHRSRSTWLLLAPVLTIFLVAPPALGSDAVNRAGSRTVAAPTRDSTHRNPFPALAPRELEALRFTDVVTRAGWDSAGTLDGKPVRITGFLSRNKAGTPFLARMIISCCAADAFPITARLADVDLQRYPDDQWLTVTGTVEPYTATEANRYTPLVRVQTAQPIPVPEDPYEY